MKRLVWIPLLALLALTACAPSAAVVSNVVPTLVSVQLPQDGGAIVLQGRYFGDGAGGAESYVLVGAKADCSEGTQVAADAWSSNRIEFSDPGNVGYGFVCVVVDGTASNGLPLDLD